MMSDELFDKSKDNQIRQNGLIMDIDEVVDLLNSQSKLISAYMYEFSKMRKENKQLKSYIDTIFGGNSHICKRLNVEDVQFYCEINRDYCYPSCTYKKCFDENNLIGLKDEIRRCNE